MDPLRRRSHRDPPHIHLIERGEHCAGVLSLLQPLGDPQPHPVHLHLDGQMEEMRGSGFVKNLKS